MTLNPETDTKVDKYNLHNEASNISHLIFLYDQQWSTAVGRLEKLNAQIENLNDSMKVLRMELFFKAKSGDGKQSDKMAEAIAFSSPEYIDEFNKLKILREERAEALTTEQLFRCYHYILLEKAKSIDLLTRQFTAQYFTLDRKIQNVENSQKEKESVNAVSEMTDMLNTKPRRKLKQ